MSGNSGAVIVAAQPVAGPRPAPPGDPRDLIWEQVAAGANPAIPTSADILSQESADLRQESRVKGYCGPYRVADTKRCAYGKDSIYLSMCSAAVYGNRKHAPMALPSPSAGWVLATWRAVPCPMRS
jgi:hypothetical protein